MIQIESVTINDFRGIRQLTLNFNGKNFAVCGPNGTGKSGVVDAVEFALTGDVSRLSGEGKGDVSVKVHGPHVDYRNNPDKARVKVTLSIPSLGQTATLERSAKTPASATVSPADPAILKILRQVEEHPEIVLSRRELIRYVLATPGDRAREVQSLLHLDRVAQVRSGLLKIANGAEKQLPGLALAVARDTENLLRALGITELNVEKLLAAVNSQRAILGLPALLEFTPTTSLRDGLAAPVPAKAQSIPKAQALADIKAALDLLNEIAGADFAVKSQGLATEVAGLAADPACNLGVNVGNFYSTGLNLIDAERCPFCDTSWNLEELKAHVQAKLERLKEFTEKRLQTETKTAPVCASLERIRASLTTLLGYGAVSTPPIDMPHVRDFAARCKDSKATLTAFVPLGDTLKVLATIATIPQPVIDEITALQKVVGALPDPNKQDSAREYLAVATERLNVWREAKRAQKTATEQAKRSRQVSDTYAATSDKLLAELYAEVQKDFAALYSFVNRNDEKNFSAKLIPSMGKLGFDVDFYGRGFFPPGAYHSEGHQDGMGLCLYLALMRHLHGDAFTLAVLDDVLMSVDTGHRREVCALLKKEFPRTQFIITTHDPVWLRHMKTVGLIAGKNGVQFRTWSVDQGPAQWDDRDVWAEIDDHLKRNDVRAAAALLRHFLEYTSAEFCHNLRAPVEFRSDGLYQLGELLPQAAARLRKLYREGKTIAEGWKQTETVTALASREAEFGKLVAVSQMEQWQVNAAVHFNSWDNLTKADFEPVVKAYRDLVSGFICSDCREPLYVSPDRDSAESLRCGCGKTNVNLVKKTS